jgi:hypothetical protein
MFFNLQAAVEKYAADEIRRLEPPTVNVEP